MTVRHVMTVLVASRVLAAQNVTATVRYERYVIQGTTTGAMAAQMQALGPRDSSGVNPALTRADRHTSLSYRTTARGCEVGDVHVALDVTIILPNWEVPATASPALVAEWQRFAAALGAHELGHRDIAVRGAQQLVDAVRKLRGSTCETVHRAAEDAARDVAVLTRIQQPCPWQARHVTDTPQGSSPKRQLAYDDVTRHGLSQGTSLRAAP